MATSTTRSGVRPLWRHLMLANFSTPKSAPKPASVMVYSDRRVLRRVAAMELQPWAILAKGPPWTKAGLPSRVCTKLGWQASLSSTAIAPWTARSAARMVSRDRVWATTIRPSRSLSSARDSERQRIAMTSEATAMSNPDWRGKELAVPPSPMTISRSARSFMSRTRFQTMRRGSMRRTLPWWM